MVSKGSLFIFGRARHVPAGRGRAAGNPISVDALGTDFEKITRDDGFDVPVP
jgi:hypothetical protein